MDWPQVLTLVGTNVILFLSMLGVTITLYLHGDRKIDAIREDVRDFHERLIEIEKRKK